MILLIDNYDSFVFNLQRYLARLGQATCVVRNDEVDRERLASGEFSAVVISPGPKAPSQAGKSLEIVREFSHRLPMLGVCLGHQVICQAFGASIVRAPRAMHGQASLIDHEPSRLFDQLPTPFAAARYHSLVADAATLPPALRVIGTTPGEAGQSPIVMAVEHIELPIFGVQFHPESILSSVGYRILANFLRLAGLPVSRDLPHTDFASPAVWEGFSEPPREPVRETVASPETPWAVLPQAPKPSSDSQPGSLP